MKCTELETWLHIRNRDSLGLGCLQENTDQDKGGALMGPHCVQTSLQTGCQLDASSISCPPTRTSVSCFNLCLRVFITDTADEVADVYFLTMLEATSPRPRFWPIQFVVRDLSVWQTTAVWLCPPMVSVCAGAGEQAEERERESCLVSRLTRILILSD